MQAERFQHLLRCNCTKCLADPQKPPPKSLASNRARATSGCRTTGRYALTRAQLSALRSGKAWGKFDTFGLRPCGSRRSERREGYRTRKCSARETRQTFSPNMSHRRSSNSTYSQWELSSEEEALTAHQLWMRSNHTTRARHPEWCDSARQF